MEGFCESDPNLTQLTPTVCHYLEQSFFQLMVEIQLIFHSLTSPKGNTNKGKNILRLSVFRQIGLVSFFLFFPYSVYKWFHSLPHWVKFHQYTCCGWAAFPWQSLSKVWVIVKIGWCTEESREKKNQISGISLMSSRGYLCQPVTSKA